MTNYFQLFGIEAALHIDKKALRRSYLQKSQEYHPDFHSQSSEEQQAAMLEASSQLNEAYELLLDEEGRLRHLLAIEGIDISQSAHQQLPPAFLASIMELNEALMDVAFAEESEETKRALEKEIAELREEAEREVAAYSGALPEENKGQALEALRVYALKLPYFRRFAQALRGEEREL